MGNIDKTKNNDTKTNAESFGKHKLRSSDWYGKKDKDGFIHRSWMKSQGFPSSVFSSNKPVIGICNTWSELTPCNSHLQTVAESVKRGVWEAGGFPVEFPAMSLGETQMRPTAMLFRNLLAMEVEESIRANPLDGVVLLGGCDKTTPGQLMGAASVDLPTIVISSGPMLSGNYRGKPIGSGTDVWKFSEEVRSGKITQAEFEEIESAMSRSKGVCMTMGTASSVSSLVEAMGLSLPWNGTLPAVDARRYALAQESGRRIVEMVWDKITLSSILAKNNFENAIVVNSAIGGSSNIVLHLLALAGRVGVNLTLSDFSKVGANIPLLVDIMPSGKYLMEDFCYAGGVGAVIKELGNLIDGSAKTVNGKTIQQQISNAEIYNSSVIKPLSAPLKKEAGLHVLYGNLAPKGAIIKPSAASEKFMKHSGPAFVFKNIEDMKKKIEDPNSAITENHVLVLKGCGPKGYPGMAEVGNMPIPKKLLRQGVTDMVRVSDARMSGTAFGTVVLHVCPESNDGGPLALVCNDDIITLDVYAGKISLDVNEEELARRKANWKKEPAIYNRGYYKLYIEHVMGADTGADLDFLIGKSTNVKLRESH